MMSARSAMLISFFKVNVFFRKGSFPLHNHQSKECANESNRREKLHFRPGMTKICLLRCCKSLAISKNVFLIRLCI